MVALRVTRHSRFFTWALGRFRLPRLGFARLWEYFGAGKGIFAGPFVAYRIRKFALVVVILFRLGKRRGIFAQQASERAKGLWLLFPVLPCSARVYGEYLAVYNLSSMRDVFAT